MSRRAGVRPPRARSLEPVSLVSCLALHPHDPHLITAIRLFEQPLPLVAAVAAFAVARYLPNIPYANRLVLAPPGEKDGVEDTTAASGVIESS